MLPTIAVDASRDIAANVTFTAVIGVLILLAASAIAARWFTRRHDTRQGAVAWFAAIGSVAGCVSLTLLREGLPTGFQPLNVFAWTTTGWDRLAGEDIFGSSQFLLNVALFIPAGLAWTWATNRPWRTLGGLVGLTMVIESIQAVTGAGGPDITDVAANSLGASIGVGAAAVVTAVLVRAGLATGNKSNPRRRALIAAGFVVAVVVTLTALFTGADRRQGNIQNELETVFSDTTYDDIAAVLLVDPDSPEKFDEGARFADPAQIYGAISVRSNGQRDSDDQIEVRWPAVFFGFRRCVYVTWTRSDLEFRSGSGRECTEFIG